MQDQATREKAYAKQSTHKLYANRAQANHRIICADTEVLCNSINMMGFFLTKTPCGMLPNIPSNKRLAGLFYYLLTCFFQMSWLRTARMAL